MRSKVRTSARHKPKKLAKHEHRHYLPYLPSLVLIIAILAVTIFQPQTKIGVLAYATEMSSSGLLSSTNNRRVGNGVKALTLNSKLSAAAQAKANDMVARNYWSHNTPDGQEPWVFFEQAGYKFIKAGENLAYGFATSDSTITGWMNSPSHKDNLLDPAFTEVGFGFANSADYNNNGNETVVVAEYGHPQTLAAESPAPSPAASQPRPIAAAPTPALAQEETAQPEEKKDSALPVNTDNKGAVEPAQKSISRVENITGGNAPWAYFAVGITLGAVVTFLMARHIVGLKKLIKTGEHMVLANPLIDTLLMGLILVGVLLTQTTGFIK